MNRKHRKRSGQIPQTDRNPLSTSLRQALNQIQRGDFANGLSSLDQLAGQYQSAEAKAKILSIVGDVYMRRLDYGAAVTAYDQAGSNVANHPRAWLRPAIGSLLARLANSQYPEALTQAEAIVDRGNREATTHAQQILQAAAATATGTVVTVAGLPYRPCVLLARLGHIFLDNGFVEESESFFKRALAAEPNGSSRSRQGLAEIAVRRQQWSEAAAHALDAITVGKFQRKTLSALPIYLKASIAAGATPDVPMLLARYGERKKSIRDQAYFLCVTELRAAHANWQETAQAWLDLPGSKDPVIECEIDKLRLSAGKMSQAPASARITLAEQVLDTPDVRFAEWSFAAREVIKASGGNAPSHKARLVADAVRRYGESFRWQAVHRIARAAKESGQSALARAWLTEATQTMPSQDSARGRIHWALAKLEEEAENSAGAAACYLAVYTDASTPSRYRPSALIAWARNAVQAGQTEELLARKPDFEQALAQSQDYVLLLDTSRLLLVAPRELNALRPALLERGERLARKVIQTSKDPATSRQACFALFKRLSCCGANDRIVAIWQELGESKQEWLWSNDEAFWEIVDYVVRAHRRLGHPEEALAFAQTYLNDPSTPACGVAHLGTQSGLTRLCLKDIAGAMANFEQVVKTAPAHLMAGYAHYWLALRAYAQGRPDQTASEAAKIKYCVGDAPRLSWQRRLRTRGALLEARLDIQAMSADADANRQRVLKENLGKIQSDLATL